MRNGASVSKKHPSRCEEATAPGRSRRDHRSDYRMFRPHLPETNPRLPRIRAGNPEDQPSWFDAWICQRGQHDESLGTTQACTWVKPDGFKDKTAEPRNRIRN